MDRVLLDLGFIKIYWYSITMLLGISLGTFFAYKEFKKKSLDKDFFFNLIFYIVIFGFIGARIYYVLFNLDYYFLNPFEIIAIWNGGLAIHGAIIAGLITIIVYCKKKHQNVFLIMDTLSIGLLIGQIIGRWGNFFNQEAHGGVTTLEFLQRLHLPKFIIDQMYIGGSYYLPTFLFESIYNLIGLIILLIIKNRTKIKQGQIFSLYLIWYGIGRFFIESLRTDSLMFENFRVAQIVSIIMILAGTYLFMKNKNNELYRKEKL